VPTEPDSGHKDAEAASDEQDGPHAVKVDKALTLELG
jgi:hypothetical protein